MRDLANDITGSGTCWGKALPVARLSALLLSLCVTSGCAVNVGGPVASLPGPGSAFGPTVAFESVDGPPPQVFDRLVRSLEVESGGGRSFSIVSREAPAAYRIRSYLSAQVRRGKTTVAWVWDIYDRDQQRALRLSGEEQGGKSGGNAWNAADEPMLLRIAQAGLNGVGSLISGASPAQQPTEPTRSGPAIAASDEPGPEAATLAFSTH